VVYELLTVAGREATGKRGLDSASLVALLLLHLSGGHSDYKEVPKLSDLLTCCARGKGEGHPMVSGTHENRGGVAIAGRSRTTHPSFGHTRP
jgi:hypothetical protein